MPVIRTCSHCGQKNRIPSKYLASVGRCGVCKSPLPPIAEPLAVDETLFDEVVQNAPVPILVDLWAEWSGSGANCGGHVGQGRSAEGRYRETSANCCAFQRARHTHFRGSLWRSRGDAAGGFGEPRSDGVLAKVCFSGFGVSRRGTLTDSFS